RLTHGVSPRQAGKVVSIRQISWVRTSWPPSVNTNFSDGYFSNTPSVMRLARCVPKFAEAKVGDSMKKRGYPSGVGGDSGAVPPSDRTATGSPFVAASAQIGW